MSRRGTMVELFHSYWSNYFSQYEMKKKGTVGDAKYFNDKIKYSSEEILFEIKCISWKLSLEPKAGDE